MRAPGSRGSGWGLACGHRVACFSRPLGAWRHRCPCPVNPRPPVQSPRRPRTELCKDVCSAGGGCSAPLLIPSSPEGGSIGPPCLLGLSFPQALIPGFCLSRNRTEKKTLSLENSITPQMSRCSKINLDLPRPLTSTQILKQNRKILKLEGASAIVPLPALCFKDDEMDPHW